jgi:hypothetical protein
MTVAALLKAYYLSQPNRTEDGWQQVANNPQHFNMLWNRALGLSLSNMPPPQEYRGVEILRKRLNA